MTATETRANLESIIKGKSLSEEQSFAFFSSVMRGEVSEILLSSFLTALASKGESAAEITGAVKAMREASVKPPTEPKIPVLDTCGTGGDGKGSLNVSTLSAIVLASLGVPVAKHGNRSVSSVSGSSDILEAAHYQRPKPEDAVRELESKNFVFLFAPDWHPAMRFAAPVRKELGIRTLFNILGPLANPLKPAFQILGVFSETLLANMADVLLALGVARAIVCHSRDGLDEFSLFAETDFEEIKGAKRERKTFSPKELPLSQPPDASQIFVQTKEQALERFWSVLGGIPSSGLDLVALNAGVGLFAMDRVSSIPEGFQTAKTALLEKKVGKFARETLNLS